MARPIRKDRSRPGVRAKSREVPLAEVKDDWLDYKLETDLRFLKRIERARASLREGKGIRLEDADV